MNNRKSKIESKERYLRIPYHILNLAGIGICEKVLLAHIYSFGRKGCYQSNRTLADIFMVSAYTISRWMRDIKEHVHVKNPRGYYRTMWAKSHPDVQLAVRQWSDYGKSAQHPMQKCRGDYGKSAFLLRQNCRTTNNNTIKETKQITTATPSPLPAGGQAPALLESRQEERLARIEQFKSKFAIVGKRHVPLAQKEFNDRRNRQLAALRVRQINECKAAGADVK